MYRNIILNTHLIIYRITDQRIDELDVLLLGKQRSCGPRITGRANVNFIEKQPDRLAVRTVESHSGTLKVYYAKTEDAYFQKINGNTILMIALTKKRRRWFADLWNYPVNLPFFSNA